MPLFRRKTAPSLPRTSSISIYGQGRAQALQRTSNTDRGSTSSIDLDDRPHPLAFAEATFDPSLPIKTKSRLSKDLEEILHDNAALAYFIQFMDAKNAKHLVKFWLDAESFRVSAETKAKKQVKQTDEPVACETNLSATTSASSGSSGYISDKSDDLFQSSSQTVSSVQKENIENDPGCGTASVLNVNIHKVNGMSNVYSSKDTSVSNSEISHGDSVICKFKNVTGINAVDSGCKYISGESVPSIELTLEDGDNADQCDVVSGAGDKPSSTVVGCDGRELCDKDIKTEVHKDRCARLETSMQQDAIAIYLKFISPEASCAIGIPDDLRSIIKDIVFKPDGSIESRCFIPAQQFVVQRMDKEFYPHFLGSSFHCTHQIDVLTSGTVFLADVLYNDSALFFFMEYMEQEKVRHLVDFLLTADNFRKHLTFQRQQGTYDGMQAQNDAMVLYDKYFSLQATIPLGFSDSVRFELEANICQENGPEPDCFSKPVRILTQYLEKTYLLQFLNCQLYFKYISECIIIIQNEGSDTGSLKRSIGTGSDSGSEQSLPISSINTLLAMDGKQPGASRFARGADGHGYRADPFHIKPDEIWQRPVSGRLQMAHVDHLGRVTTEFEMPDSDKKKGESKISKAMKKLVNWDEDKNQEEMAWKVAEMIVKDICSVTMPDYKYPVSPQKSQSVQPPT